MQVLEEMNKDYWINGKRITLIILMLILLAVSMNPVSSISGQGSTITMNGLMGVSNYNYSASQSSFGSSYIGPVGYYSGSSIDGYFGTPMDSIQNFDLTVQNPDDSSVFDANINFRYDINTESPLTNCSIFLDGSLNDYQTNIGTGNYTKIFTGLSISKHIITIICNSLNVKKSVTRAISVILYNSFDGNSTDLSNINMSSIPNLTLSKTAGKIIFPGLTNLSSGVDLDSNVIISQNTISINSLALPSLNKSATLYLYDIPYNYPFIWKDGVPCFGCSIVSVSSGTLVFNVPGFSNYEITSNAKLQIFDDSDIAMKLPNQSLTFYANYTNISSGQPISADCIITINGSGYTPTAMSYNVTSGLYYYDSSFNSSRSSIFDVSCSPVLPLFDTLNLTDSFLVGSSPPNTFSDFDIEQKGSSRSTLKTGAALNATAGNVTEISLNGNAITKVWQGYYGDVTGRVLLADANNNTFYDWKLVSSKGEIYASRTVDIDWKNIRCANLAELYAEDIVLGINSTLDGDSLNDTFFNTTDFDLFYAGSKIIDPTENCYATNLYNGTGKTGAFKEVILSDNHNLLYTGLINTAVGFDNQQHDFQMLVGSNGHLLTQQITNYYFFVEIG